MKVRTIALAAVGPIMFAACSSGGTLPGTGAQFSGQSIKLDTTIPVGKQSVTVNLRMTDDTGGYLRGEGDGYKVELGPRNGIDRGTGDSSSNSTIFLYTTTGGNAQLIFTREGDPGQAVAIALAFNPCMSMVAGGLDASNNPRVLGYCA